MKKRLLILSLLIAIGGILFLGGKVLSPSNPTPRGNTSTNFNRRLYSVDGPTSIWVVVNKKRPLNPANYAPADLVMPSVPLRVPGHESMQVRGVMADPLTNMFTAAQAQGLNLLLASGYRSYTYQVDLYNGYVHSLGQAAADEQSARPGYSEHQTGLAVDIEPLSRNCELDQCFADTPEGKWLAANAYKYGFILRYTSDKVKVTGYQYEPWHFRFVGTELAAELHAKNIQTLEEFFDLPGGTQYN